MMRRSSLLGALAILWLASVAAAQPPGGQGRGGFGRPGAMPASPALLLGMPEVRKELGSSAGQNKLIDDLLAETQEQLRASFGAVNFQELQNQSPEERQKRFDEARKKSDAALKRADETLGKILNAPQRERLSQLWLQREGPAALHRPEIAQQLGLTDAQQEKLRKLQEDGGPPFARGPEQRQKAEADTLTMLTTEQKAKWAVLKGQEFKFPEGPGAFGPGGPAFMGGFGPGGPGGPLGQQRKLVKQFDKDGDARLNKEERQAARDFLKKERPAGGRGGFGPGPGPGAGRIFGPGVSVTKPLLEALDADKDGTLTKNELAAGVQRFLKDTDKDKKGSLDEAQVGAGLDRILLLPLEFAGGPPGGPPGGGGFRVLGPGSLFAGAIVRRADANQDGKVTPTELAAAAEALFHEADKNKDGKLDETELAAGVALLAPAPQRFGPPGGFGGRDNRDPPKPGARLSPADVKSYPAAGLYEPTVLRTLFLQFEDKDWEAELAEFTHSDVEVPATLVVDGKTYPNVGVHFRGMSSLMGVGAGFKRSLNLSLDFVDPKQRLYGYKTLNLLNSHEDAAFLHTVLYAHIARQHIPAPKANVVRVVINGESWGLYANAQQFDRVFLAENYPTAKGTRWKVRGSPGGDSGLSYVGENLEDYKRRYEMKTEDSDKAWRDLIALCRTLNQTPLDKLEEALKPILDIDGVLWFLALENVLINNDGYWIRASDYCIYRDDKGKFHIIPHDMNEVFQGAMGFGFGGPGGRPGGPGGGPPGPGGPGMGPRGPGIELDPLVGLDDPRKPLRSRLLAVPSLKARYLAHVRAIAEESLDWQKLGPVVNQYRSLMEKDVEADTRKLSSYDAFKRVTADAPAAEGPPGGRGPGLSLRAFADQRRKYLLNHPEVQKVTPTPPTRIERGDKQ